MKNLYLLFFMVTAPLFFYQCQSDDVMETDIEPSRASGDTIIVDQDITSNVTWTSGNTYILSDLIAVTDNAELTIEPCVVIKADVGASGLIIDRDSKLYAEGNPDCPIIFTSIEDEIVVGEIVSPNLTGNDNGLWGGLFILGNAPVSTYLNQSIVPLLPQLDLYEFGGNNADDDSGVLKYVSIRHTGYETAPGETPSGLNLAGVGSSTTIDRVELFANADDGFLVMGGTVNVNNIVTSYFQDDGYDCDLGYAGTMDNLIGIGGTSSNSSLELDGGEGQDNPGYTIRNVSFKGSQGGEEYIDFQQNVHCIIENGFFFEFDSGSNVKLDRDLDADNWLNGFVDVVNLEFNTSHLNSGNISIDEIFWDAGSNGANAFNVRQPDASIVTAPTTGASKFVFEGWTIADQTGALNEF